MYPTIRYLLFLLIGLYLSPMGVQAQRIIIPQPPMPRPTVGLFELELKKLQVDTRIDEASAVTSLDQVFFNPTDHQLQGFYFFPIPKGAVIEHFSMFINGQETKAELLDAEKARKIYEDIVRKFQDPALLEYAEQDLIRVKIFPIQPKSEQRVKLEYRHLLPSDNGTFEYTLPLQRSYNQTRTIGEVGLRVKLKTEHPIRTLYCPTQEVEIRRNGDTEATIGFEGEKIAFQSDFKLYFQSANTAIGASLLTQRESAKDAGFFYLNLSPGLGKEAPIVAKDITFVLDASGSMTGKKMEQAKKALSFCIEHLQDKDRFNIVRFSTEANSLFDELKPLDKSNKAAALEYIDALEAMGGTNIEEALNRAFAMKTKEDRPYFVIFLTDGKPTIGETQTEKLLQQFEKTNGGKTRVFTFGIGTELNTNLLDKITELTQGYRSYVLPEEDIEVKVSDFYLKVAYPVLTEVEWKLIGKVEVTDCYPRKIPDLFKGSAASVLGKFTGEGRATLLVTGKMNGREKAFEYELVFPGKTEEPSFVAPLWGARAVGYLLDQIRLNGESKELVDEVVRIAKLYGIITPYTSFLILEDEALQIGMNNIRPEDAVLSQRAPRVLREKKAREYSESMEEESGAGSVRASDEIQDMNNSENMAQTKMGRARLDYEDKTGVSRNLADDIANVQGRAQYLNNGQWLDGALANVPTEHYRINRVKFNSDAYFQLVNDHPESTPFLALGRNVRFLLGGEVWEVYE